MSVLPDHFHQLAIFRLSITQVSNDADRPRQRHCTSPSARSKLDQQQASAVNRHPCYFKNLFRFQFSLRGKSCHFFPMHGCSNYGNLELYAFSASGRSSCVRPVCPGGEVPYLSGLANAPCPLSVPNSPVVQSQATLEFRDGCSCYVACKVTFDILNAGLPFAFSNLAIERGPDYRHMPIQPGVRGRARFNGGCAS